MSSYETSAFLRKLREMGKEVIMITNAHRDSLSLKLDYLLMAQYFDQLISSNDYGYPKMLKQLLSIP